jgi:hypothetical protein
VQAAAVIVAHQGGWDEILLVAGPILAIVGLLALAKRRVDRAAPRPDGNAAAQDHGQDRDPDQDLGS